MIRESVIALAILGLAVVIAALVGVTLAILWPASEILMPIDTTKLLAFVGEKDWMLVAALVIGALVRLTKADVSAFPTVAARWRPLVAVGIGLLLSACDALIAGTPPKEALVAGLGAAMVAILGHVFGIEVLRGGREIAIGTNKPKGPPPNIPSTIPVSMMLALALSGCSLLRPKSALDWAQATCIAANAFLDVPALRQVCPSIQDLSDADVNQLLSAARQGGARYAAQRGAAQ